MNFTKRQNGTLMTTMRPAVHIGRSEIQAGIYHAMTNSLPLPVTRAGAVKIATTYVINHGLFHIEDELEEDTWDKAGEITDKIFPELKA